nr:glycoside hydrolase [Gammaproteobacteria bacterium]
QHVVFIPENMTNGLIDLNVMDFYSIVSNLNVSNLDISDLSISYEDGVDVALVNTNNLNFDLNNFTITGGISLPQALDFEIPIDGNNDNDYEIANIIVSNTDNVSNSFIIKIVVQIGNVLEISTLEILIDSHLLDDINDVRDLRELYLYGDSTTPDPNTGIDSNNILSAGVVASTAVIGAEDVNSDITKLYDSDDTLGNGFLTATSINSNSNSYHRLTFNFTQELGIVKVAIRGRKSTGYYGFVFIFRNASGDIIYAHRATNDQARGDNGSPMNSFTYSFVPDTSTFTPITDFGIGFNSQTVSVTVDENITEELVATTTTTVASGYEYERVFITLGGVDAANFTTNNLRFINNELRGLKFKAPPDYEIPIDANRNNVYELVATGSNIDGGSNAFAMQVAVNDLTFLSLNSTAATSNVTIYTTNIIADVSSIIDFVEGDYSTVLSGDDASYFELQSNTLKTTNDFGFSSIYENDGEYRLQVEYITNGMNAATFSLTVLVEGSSRGVNNPPWSYRYAFQSVVLTNNDILVIGGDNGGGLLNDIWRSSDGGANWSQITNSAPWAARSAFQSVVLTNNDILVMGGIRGANNNLFVLNDIWRSSDGGTNWSQIPASNHWPTRKLFESVVLANNDILVMGGVTNNGAAHLNDIWRSSDGGTNWSQIPASNHWPAMGAFQSVVLTNEDILVIGGSFNTIINGISREVWQSSDGGTNWTIRGGNFWSNIAGYTDPQAVVLENNDVLIIGGYQAMQEFWLGEDGGNDWRRLSRPPWYGGYYQVVVLTNKALIMGGLDSGGNVWEYELYNTNF